MFLLYNATLPSSALVDHLLIALETDWLTKHSTVDCCCLNRIKLVNSCVVNNISLSALVAKRLMRVWEKAVIAAYIVLILN